MLGIVTDSISRGGGEVSIAETTRKVGRMVGNFSETTRATKGSWSFGEGVAAWR